MLQEVMPVRRMKGLDVKLIKSFWDKIAKRELRTIFPLSIVLLGVLLAMITELRGASPNLWYFLWTILPYGAYGLAATKAKSVGALIGGGLLILGLDIVNHIQVFYFPGSSTDSIALLTMPFWQIVIIMPLGFLFGWLIERMIAKVRKHD